MSDHITEPTDELAAAQAFTDTNSEAAADEISDDDLLNLDDLWHDDGELDDTADGFDDTAAAGSEEFDANTFLDPFGENFGSNLTSVIEGAIDRARSPLAQPVPDPPHPSLILDARAAEIGVDFDRDQAMKTAAEIFEAHRDRYPGSEDVLAEAALLAAADMAANNELEGSVANVRLGQALDALQADLGGDLNRDQVVQLASGAIVDAGLDPAQVDARTAAMALRLAAEVLTGNDPQREQTELDIAARFDAVERALVPPPASLPGDDAADEMEAAARFVGGVF